ncbi:MAG: hypothetical protein ABIK77_01295 [candidate division WOR-3 bacterium]
MNFFTLFLFLQIVDTIIRFSDEPNELLYIPQRNELFINFRRNNYHMVLDCSTYEIKRIIQRICGYEGSAYGVFNWKRNKVYFCFNPSPDSIIIIDSNFNTKVISWHAQSLVYNAWEDKIYSPNGRDIGVIDCFTDSIIKVINSQHYFCGLPIFDSIGNKVYCGACYSDLLNVIDCKNDSIIKEIHTSISCPSYGVLNKFRRKAYIGAILFDLNNLPPLIVISTQYDSMIKTTNIVPYFPFHAMTIRNPIIWNFIEDKIYLVGWVINGNGGIIVVNPYTDSAIKVIPESVQNMRAWEFLPFSNRIYFTENINQIFYLCVLDCSTDSIISKITLGRKLFDIEVNPKTRQIYITDLKDSALYVIKDEVGIVEKKDEREKIKKMNEISNYKEVIVYEITGRKIKTGCSEKNLEKVLPKGVYYLQIERKDKKEMLKIVIQ